MTKDSILKDNCYSCKFFFNRKGTAIKCSKGQARNLNNMKRCNLFERAVPARGISEQRINILKNWLSGMKFERLLDVGCSEGTITHFLSGITKNTYAIDAKKTIINYANAINRYEKRKIKFMVGNAQKLRFKDEYFDALTALEVIEHLEDPAKFITEANRVLKPGGLLFISTPNDKRLQSSVFRAIGKKPRKAPDHINEFSKKELLNLLSSKGFEPLECFTTPINFKLLGKEINLRLLSNIFGYIIIVKTKKITKTTI